MWRDWLAELVREDEIEVRLGIARELFLERADAEVFLVECVEDVPEWADVLSVQPVELDERDVSAN